MTLLDSLMAQGLRAYRQPRAAAADVLALGFPRHALAPALLLVVVSSVVLNTISEYLAPSPFVIISPFQMVMLLTVMLLLFSFAITKGIHINFIAALHGFSSLGPAVGVFLLALVMTFFGLMLVAPLFVTPVGDFANV